MDNNRYEAYKNHLGHFSRSMKIDAHFEGVVLLYALFEDTTFRFFKDIGWISQNGKTISKPYKKLYKNKIDPSVKEVSIESLAKKLNVISKIIDWAFENEKSDEHKLKDLHKTIRNKLDREEVFSVLNNVSLWRQKRNAIIHASLNRPFDIVVADAKALCEEGTRLFRYLDDKIVKKLKIVTNKPKRK